MSIQNGRPKVGIIGAGVSGLSCGIWLARLGFDVQIWSKDNPQELVSSKAGAVWFPFQAEPRALIERLSLDTFNDLVTLAEKYPDAGVAVVKARLIYQDRLSKSDHDFVCGLNPKPIPGEMLPKGYKNGLWVNLPFVDTTVYMPFLAKAFRTAGGRMISRQVQDIAEVSDSVDLLVNCSGLGARELFGDTEVFPIRGQTVLVEKWSDTAFFMDQTDDDAPGYIFTRAHDCLLGGTVEPNQGDTTPSDAIHEDILARCAAMAPEVLTAKVLNKSVGLRPGRTQLRLQREDRPNGHPTILHNYGHGGSGFTISWGCARQIVNWTQDIFPAPVPNNTAF